ncbi:MAG: DPP IV N-terminal domain-containing protein, partial [Armatimonadota bacterium]|nr:DPP IV N-terminal domain-containing protein [Armatimonadota bacterium]
LTTHSALDSAPAFNPNGSNQIAFVSTRDGDPEIYVMNAVPEGAGNQPVKLTDNNREDRNPSFSLNGQQIVFASNRDNAASPDIYVMDANGGNPRRVTTSGGNDDPAFSPDGGSIVFVSTRFGASNPEIFVINADGQNEVRLTTNATVDAFPDWR